MNHNNRPDDAVDAGSSSSSSTTSSNENNNKLQSQFIVWDSSRRKSAKPLELSDGENWIQVVEETKTVVKNSGSDKADQNMSNNNNKSKFHLSVVSLQDNDRNNSNSNNNMTASSSSCFSFPNETAFFMVDCLAPEQVMSCGKGVTTLEDDEEDDDDPPQPRLAIKDFRLPRVLRKQDGNHNKAAAAAAVEEGPSLAIRRSGLASWMPLPRRVTVLIYEGDAIGVDMGPDNLLVKGYVLTCKTTVMLSQEEEGEASSPDGLVVQTAASLAPQQQQEQVNHNPEENDDESMDIEEDEDEDEADMDATQQLFPQYIVGAPPLSSSQNYSASGGFRGGTGATLGPHGILSTQPEEEEEEEEVEAEPETKGKTDEEDTTSNDKKSDQDDTMDVVEEQQPKEDTTPPTSTAANTEKEPTSHSSPQTEHFSSQATVTSAYQDKSKNAQTESQLAQEKEGYVYTQTQTQNFSQATVTSAYQDKSKNAQTESQLAQEKEGYVYTQTQTQNGSQVPASLTDQGESKKGEASQEGLTSTAGDATMEEKKDGNDDDDDDQESFDNSHPTVIASQLGIGSETNGININTQEGTQTTNIHNENTQEDQDFTTLVKKRVSTIPEHGNDKEDDQEEEKDQEEEDDDASESLLPEKDVEPKGDDTSINKNANSAEQSTGDATVPTSNPGATITESSPQAPETKTGATSQGYDSGSETEDEAEAPMVPSPSIEATKFTGETTELKSNDEANTNDAFDVSSHRDHSHGEATGGRSSANKDETPVAQNLTPPNPAVDIMEGHSSPAGKQDDSQSAHSPTKRVDAKQNSNMLDGSETQLTPAFKSPAQPPAKKTHDDAGVSKEDKSSDFEEGTNTFSKVTKPAEEEESPKEHQESSVNRGHGALVSKDGPAQVSHPEQEPHGDEKDADRKGQSSSQQNENESPNSEDVTMSSTEKAKHGDDECINTTNGIQSDSSPLETAPPVTCNDSTASAKVPTDANSDISLDADSTNAAAQGKDTKEGVVYEKQAVDDSHDPVGEDSEPKTNSNVDGEETRNEGSSPHSSTNTSFQDEDHKAPKEVGQKGNDQKTRRQVRPEPHADASMESPTTRASTRTRQRRTRTRLELEPPTSIATPARSSKRKAVRHIAPASATRSKRSKKDVVSIKVITTGLELLAREKKMVTEIGGTLVDNVEEATHVIASDIVLGRRVNVKAPLRRTPKLMAALCVIDNIVDKRWLSESAKNGNPEPPENYLVNDTEAEEKYKMVLRDSIARSKIMREEENRRLLSGYSVYIIKGVDGVNTRTHKTPKLDEFKMIINAAGGRLLGQDELYERPTKNTDYSKFIIVTSKLEDEKKKQLREKYVKDAIKDGARDVDTETFFDSFMRQQLLF